MRPIEVSTSGVSTSAVIPVDLGPATHIGLQVEVTGAATYTVEYTFDDIWDSAFNPATAAWDDHSTLVGLSANAVGNLAFPPRGVRLNQTAGVGSAVLRYVQTGPDA